MNYAQTILNQLKKGPGFSEILLAPGAKPYVREGAGLSSFGDATLTADDVLETLTTLLARVPASNVTLEKRGVFSFGLPQRGRFRVSYLTQRGSYAMSISEIPLVVPELAETWANPASAQQREELILSATSGLFVLTSSNTMVANILAYAILKRINETQDRVIFTVEPYVTYMLRHVKSVVLQSEVGGDVESVEEGVNAALNLSPNLLYVRGVTSTSDLNAALKAVKYGVMTIVTAARVDVPALLNADRLPLDASLMQGVWRVEMSEVLGKLTLEV